MNLLFIFSLCFISLCLGDDCIKFNAGSGYKCIKHENGNTGPIINSIEETQFCCGIVNGVYIDNTCYNNKGIDYTKCCGDHKVYMQMGEYKDISITQCNNGTIIFNKCVYKKVACDSMDERNGLYKCSQLVHC